MEGEGKDDIVRDENLIAQENREANDLGPTDDVVQSRQPNAEQPEHEAEPEKKEPQLRSGKFEDKRQQIAEKARARRADEASELAEEIATTRAEAYGQPGQEPEKPAAEQPQAEQPPARKFKLKVNGQEIDVDEAQVIAHAQQSIAAGNIMEQAKRDRATAATILETLRATTAGKPTAEEPVSEPAKPAPKTVTKLSPEDLADLAEKFQYGEKEDVIAALQKHGDAVAERAVEQIISNLDDRIAEQVEVINESRQRRSQSAEVLNAFVTDFPEYGKSQALQHGLATQASETMRSKMLAIGVKPETFEKLRNDHNLSDIEAVSYAYRSLKRQGFELPDHAAVLREADGELRKAYGLPAREARPTPKPANHNFDPQQRIERKREIVPQPRRAGATPVSEQQQANREQRQVDAIRQMRAARRGR